MKRLSTSLVVVVALATGCAPPWSRDDPGGQGGGGDDPADAAAVVPDASVPGGQDAAVLQQDAGSPGTDGSVATDGAVSRDAGAVGDGAVRADASSPPDAGVPDAAPPDRDRDGVPDATDLCPDQYDPGQEDSDGDGTGDACQPQQGTWANPFIIPASPPLPEYTDARDTRNAPSDDVDLYPPSTANEAGPEFVYVFRTTSRARVHAWIDFPEPDGVDVDVHLLSGLDPLTLVARDHHDLVAQVEPGTYWLALDTYVNGAGTELPGPYNLHVVIREVPSGGAVYFNDYVLRAVEWLYANYGLLGYDSAVLTHDIEYGTYGTITRTGGARTMCVAAVMEVMLTAMQIYAQETGDASVWDYLPKSSWERLNASAIKAHIWVNHELDSWGTADALVHFGMGETVVFEHLTPGAFINLNRTTGTGHAVVFLGFIDIQGNVLPTHSSAVVGFKYFSSQGGYDEGAGGLDYRYAVFSEHGSPTMPYRRDVNVIYSTNQHYLNTGMMYAPALWMMPQGPPSPPSPGLESRFDPVYFDGKTLDD
jgi:hypothetical protein